MNQSQKILESWTENAERWITTIEQNEIESRVAATNEAIVSTVLGYRPATILDIGCGEGWLTRRLRAEGINSTGVDAIQKLVDVAIEKDGPHYLCYSYRQLAEGVHQLPVLFHAAVINFALIDQEETEKLIQAIPSLLHPNGLLFIQTLHPFSVASTGAYQSGWREGSWDGLKQAFTHPYQWYFRTFEDWVSLFSRAGFSIEAIREPVHPQTGKPVSAIFVLRSTFKSSR